MKEQSRHIRTIIFACFFLLAVGIAVMMLWQRYALQHPPLPELGAVPSLSLTTNDRRTFTEQDFKGKVTITDFIFTTCAGP